MFAGSAALRISPFVKTLAVLVFVAALIPATLAAAQEKTLSKNDVVSLLEGGVPSSRVATLANERGIDFEIDPAVESELRQAGASDELITALRALSHKPGVPSSPAKATLQIETSPGEADIYLNDEPRGTTSPEGRLVLSGLDPGSYRLRAFAKGYESWQQSVRLGPGDVWTVKAQLVAKTPVQAVPATAGTSAPAAAPAEVDLPALLASAKTLCVSITPGSNPALKTAIDEKLINWGKLKLVSSPSEADLTLSVQQTGRQILLNAGNQAGAVLRARNVDVDLWATSKGGGLSLRGYSVAKVGRALADDFIKLYESKTGRR
jgi:hypothetical protein